MSASSGPEIPSGTTITIHGTNFNGGVTPIVDFGTVASIGSITYSSTQITTTIPEALSPGLVNVTVTTPVGTSPVVTADRYTYTGSGTSVAPSITSANAVTFAAGTANAFNVTTSGTPAVSSIANTCPSSLPASISLVYTGGSSASLEGTPQAGDVGTYGICLDASNGALPDATQLFTMTISGPGTPPAQPAPPQPTHGYWLVGNDGGIFSFGSAQFHGSMGGVALQRPVVGIVPTPDRGGYWLDASDGGVFSFGDTLFYGSIPGLGFHPAGSGLPHSLNAPIVGMVPSHDDGGYFMVAADGGVFAFGDATFAGSCPGIGGCMGAAVAVVPDATGSGYWVVTNAGFVYAFGDAANHGWPGTQSSPVTARRRHTRRRWLLDPRRERAGVPLRRRRRSGRPTARFSRRLRPGGLHLRHLRRQRLLGRDRAGQGLQLGRCTLRRRHVRHAPQRPDHRRLRLLSRRRTQIPGARRHMRGNGI